MSDELQFEMDRLIAYDDASLVAELQRVAALVPHGPLTAATYDAHARTDASTIRRRLGGWQNALERAGIGDRYVGTKVTERMRDQRGRTATPGEIIAELQRISTVVDRRAITRSDLTEHGQLVSERAILSRFGSWKAALEAAGLELSKRGRRYTEDDYYENLLTVWTHYGRPPTYAEMDQAPSAISKGGYANRFGTWGRAKQAFVERVNSDIAISEEQAAGRTQPKTKEAKPRQEDQRWVPVGLRYQVLRRDKFRCVTCGRSPATHHSCVLHVDHILAFARGGKTRLDNLRALCENCNLGKGDRDG